MMVSGDYMRNRYALCLVALILLASVLPLPVLAAGEFVASSNSDVFHDPDCSYVDSIASHNLIYFDSLDDALRSGRHGCSRCNPESGNYSGPSGSSGSDFDATSYAYGFYYGKDYGYEIGYAEGIDVGREAGHDYGYAEGKKDGAEEAKAEYETLLEEKTATARKNAYSIAAVIFVPLVVFVGAVCAANQKRKSESKISTLRDQLSKAKAASLSQPLHIPPSDVHFNIREKSPEPAPAPMFFPSSAISMIDYKGGTLILTFARGGTYYYCNVPRSVYEQMLAAPSKGKFFHEHIKDVYPNV